MLQRPLQIITETSENIIINNIENIENVFVEPSDIHHKLEQSTPIPIIRHSDYFKNSNILDTYKIPELRNILKFYKGLLYHNIGCIRFRTAAETSNIRRRLKEMYDFALVGTRQKLVERIIIFFNQNNSVICIQKRIRGNFVRIANNLRGPAKKTTDRHICVNDTDFYTLEPLSNIPFKEFYSFTGANNFIYGCELSSMIQYINKRCRKVNNPYTRENIDQLLPIIYRLDNLNQIINRSYTVSNDDQYYEAPKPRVRQPSTPRPQTPPLTINVTNSISQITGDGIRILRTPSITNLYLSQEYDIAQMIARIREIRAKPLIERVQSLFMDIDQLGHYTQAQWFLQLERRDFLRYFRTLHDIWHYRAQLSFSVKQKICPLWDPFITQTEMLSNDINDIRLQNMCISVMEDMVYTGVDNDSRMLGAFHVLSALTIVSLPARNSMMWLYESLV